MLSLERRCGSRRVVWKVAHPCILSREGVRLNGGSICGPILGIASPYFLSCSPKPPLPPSGPEDGKSPVGWPGVENTRPKVQASYRRHGLKQNSARRTLALSRHGFSTAGKERL